MNKEWDSNVNSIKQKAYMYIMIVSYVHSVGYGIHFAFSLKKNRRI
jgi:hypothetical protein